jgi:hypothetical protein
MMPAKATGSKHPEPLVTPSNSSAMAVQNVPTSSLSNSRPLYFLSTLPVEGENNIKHNEDRQRSSTTNPLLGNTSDEEGAIDENLPAMAEDSVMNKAEAPA